MISTELVSTQLQSEPAGTLTVAVLMSVVGGRLSVTTIGATADPREVEGPWFAMVRVQTASSPATKFVAAMFLSMETSATAVTVTSSSSVLFDSTVSNVALETVATLVITVPAAVSLGMFTRNLMSASAAFVASGPGWVKVYSPATGPVTTQPAPVPVVLLNVTPAGSVSLTTIGPAALSGPRFSTCMVQVRPAASPAMVDVLCVLVTARSARSMTAFAELDAA